MLPMAETIGSLTPQLPAELPALLAGYAWWLLPLAIVLVAAGIGMRDLVRFSLTRVLAIASVCYRESIRRKVLLVIPLAILGVLVVSQFQVPTDEQDAIRQTIKFCLFATAVLIVLTLIILACTNLPREIENRVIYTIVTKPTTRLEIVLGKVAGFSAVSFTVLGIMGVFSYGYLNYASWRFQGDISAKLAALGDREAEKSGTVDPSQIASLEHYKQFGLLTAKRLASASKVSVVSSVPAPADKYKWSPYVMLSEVLVPFEIDRTKLQAILTAPEGATDLPKVYMEVTATHRGLKGFKTVDPSSRPFIAPLVNQDSDGRRSSLRIALFSRNAEAMIDSSQMQAQGKELAEQGETTLKIEVPRLHVATLAAEPIVYMQIAGEEDGREYGFGPEIAKLYVEYPDGRREDFRSFRDKLDTTRQLAIYRGRTGRGGQQISGSSEGLGSAGFFQFRGVELSPEDDRVGVEVHLSIERSGFESDTDDVLTVMELTIINRSPSAQISAPVVVVTGYPENNRTLFLSVPYSAVAGGDFDVAVRSKTTGHFITANNDDILVVTARQPFIVNLFKSLLVLWMMSVLIIVISVFTSTFLSWPIAVVLTLVLLTGHWAVEQLGDSLGSGMGNQIATNMGMQDPAMARVVSQSVDGLASMLTTVAGFLPDISRFSAVADIERGLLVPPAVVLESAMVLALFGLPMLALAYVFLRYKEVAP